MASASEQQMQAMCAVCEGRVKRLFWNTAFLSVSLTLFRVCLCVKTTPKIFAVLGPARKPHQMAIYKYYVL